MLRINPRGLIRSGWLLLTMLVLPFLLSACNSSDSAAPPPPPVSAVQSVVLTNGTDGIVLQWDDVIGVDGYNIYRSTSPSVATTSANLLVSNATAPYTDRTVVHGDTYYYVVTAVQGGRLSAPSPEVGATFGATDPLTTPQNVTVSPTEEVTNSLTLQWGDVAGATSYNIYYSTTPGVTALTGTKITDAVAPFIHNGLAGQTTYYYVVTAVIGGIERHESAEVSGVPRGPASGGGGDEGYGNNLSFPLIFANGYGLTGAKISNAVAPQYDYNTGLRPTATETPPTFPYFDPASAFSMGGVTYYKQKTASTWQAQWADGSATVQHVTINWGDALNSRSHTISSPVRIEAAFYRDVTSSPMTGYSMTSLYGNQRNEMFGTDTTTYVSNSAAVFEPNVRMKLEKLVAQGGAVDTSVPAQLNQAIWEGYSATEEGGSDELGLSAEVNTGGSVVYGFTWMLQNSGLGASQLQGWWRITVSLDPVATINGVDVPNNVSIDAVDPGDANTAIVSPTEATIEIQVR